MQFLTAEWFSALNDAVASVTPAIKPEARVGVGQIVHDTPSGDVSYTLFVGGNAPASVESGSIAGATATIVTDYETASAIARGTSTADLLYQGRVKLRGDAGALLRAQDALSNLSEALSTLSASTEY